MISISGRTPKDTTMHIYPDKMSDQEIADNIMLVLARIERIELDHLSLKAELNSLLSEKEKRENPQPPHSE